jgi:glycosyltransferase involved in cell wall biosynthesis
MIREGESGLGAMKLSIVIPCYNEAKTISLVIDAVKNSPIENKEIILIDDYSTDGTREIIKETIEPHIDKVVYHKRNMGKGAALRSGFKEMSGDVVIIQDADLEYDPNEYSKLLKPIMDKKADVVYGSRLAGGESLRVLFFWHSVGNKFLTLLSNMLTNLTLTDMETCYKVFNRKIIEAITVEEDRFGFEPEITAKISKLRVRIYEVGISYAGRTYEEGKKVSWKDGVRAIYCIFKYNLFR